MATILITGGSGFIAGHCILQLLEQGHDVRTTVRSPRSESAVRAAFGAAPSVVVADLTSDAGWATATADCDFVLHVASPVHPGAVENEDDVIIPARDGTLRVLRAARDAGVRRVVLTSAFHAVGYGHPHTGHTFTEDDWTVLDGPGTDAYGRSKTLAERAAWDFIATEGGAMELTTILPVAVLGPVMGPEISGANHLIQRILGGGMPGYPDLWIPIVDVRDVAAAHILALTAPEAAGQRFLVAGGPAIPLRQIGAILKSHLGEAASRVPARSIPSPVLRLAALFAPQFRPLLPDLGYARKISTEKARRLLHWQPANPEQAILAAAESMLKKNLI